MTVNDTTTTTTSLSRGTTGAENGIVENGKDVAQSNSFECLDKVGQETLLALLSSKTNVEAAERLSIAPNSLWYRIKKYNLDKIIADIPRQALMRLQLGSTRAAEKLVEKLEDRREGLQAATEILDRVGLTGDKGRTLIQNNVSGDMKLEFSE